MFQIMLTHIYVVGIYEPVVTRRYITQLLV